MTESGTDRATRQEARPSLRYWRAERNSAALYRALAEIETKPRQAAVLRKLAAVEEEHAQRWAERLRAAGTELPPFRPSRRTRFLISLARRLDVGAVLPRVASLEQLEADGYLERVELGAFEAEERANAELLRHLGHHEFSEYVKKVILKIRRPLLLVIGGGLFTVSLLLARNVQLEGLFFGLLTGVLVGPVIHYLLGKVAIALPFGRVWCGWACWTAALLDQLPYRKSAGWLPGPWRRLRYLHFALSLALVALLVLGVGYRAGALGRSAALWFLLGNVLYWSVGVTLAVALKDNRAFCKYLCPVSVILKQTSRPALLKLKGDPQACRECRSRACTTLCPMDIDIPGYIEAGKRVLSTECVFCQQCMAICPPNTLEPSFGFDLGGEERLEERPRRSAAA